MTFRFECERSRVRFPKLNFDFFFVYFFSVNHLFALNMYYSFPSKPSVSLFFFSFYYQRNFPVLLNNYVHAVTIGVSVWPVLAINMPRGNTRGWQHWCGLDCVQHGPQRARYAVA